MVLFDRKQVKLGIFYIISKSKYTVFNYVKYYSLNDEKRIDFLATVLNGIYLK